MKRPGFLTGGKAYKVALIVFVLIQVCFGVIIYIQHNRIDQLVRELDETASDLSLLESTTAEQLNKARVVVNADATSVYFPELKIKLPFNEITKTIMYSLRANDDWDPMVGEAKDVVEADISSTRFIQRVRPMTRLSCEELVRIKLEAKPSPYSPHEKPTTVKLADGRVLQVYEFVDVPECEKLWGTSGSPYGILSSDLVAEFKMAESY